MPTTTAALWRLPPELGEKKPNYHGLQIGSVYSFFTVTSASFRSPPPHSGLLLPVVGEVEFLPQPADDVDDAGVSGMT
jgi:hypothetical protein